jgi:pimeloyl-ACP methyl ester carboxylesterase
LRLITSIPAVVAALTLSPYAWVDAQISARSPLHLQTVVEGRGTPIVMLAGSTQGMQIFAPHAADLAHTHTVIRAEKLNIQFAAESRVLPADYAVRTESVALKAALDSLGFTEPVVVVGHSYGALIALDFALEYPDRVRGLVLAGAPAYWVAKAHGESPQGLKEMEQITSGFGPAATIGEEEVVRFRCGLGMCADGRRIQDDPSWPGWYRNRNALRGLAAMSLHKDRIERLNAFQKPVLIVTGQESVAFQRRINELLMQDLPNATAATLPGGQAAPVSARAEFVALVRTFVSRVTAEP